MMAYWKLPANRGFTLAAPGQQRRQHQRARQSERQNAPVRARHRRSHW
jgi:hypothetical protein